MRSIDVTHDPSLASWVDSANRPGCDFPLQNLPFAVFRRAGSGESLRCGVGIGDAVLDLTALGSAAPRSGPAAEALAACAAPALNGLMALGPAAALALRRALSELLRTGSPHAAALASALVPQARAEFAVPAHIGDYTDFYTSIHHATAVGRLLRPDSPLPPNYRWLPLGYHGRSSSIAVSGQRCARPAGQVLARGAAAPTLEPSRRLDFELELGVFIGAGNALGTPIDIGDAESHVFGLCLLNDWSARDLQAWEYQPLGPFLGKNFATTISPWIVTLEALEPFRVAWTRPPDEPQPLPYLDSPALRARGGIDIRLEVLLETEPMRQARRQPYRLTRSNFRHAYWNIAQMVAHHTVNGCNLRPGDLLGTGTQSGPLPAEAGSLLELSDGGQRALSLPDGETRRFLEDGDAVIMRGWCECDGAARIGFGEVSGRIVPASGAPRHAE